ncbi:hypothetical protein [Lamprobacter modestohalophilus]|uniref:hypothetical protein n=1 Tax=Lamprobacter modestohalophilus TaxID=1064514 RepID=UPI00190807B9|nr:hypothetical protein [Lamprobacter modestohalophilus]
MPTIADDWLAGFEQHPSGSWSCDPEAARRLDAMIDAALTGDKSAQRRAAQMAGDLMRANRAMPPALHSYIAGSLFRFGYEQCTYGQAFGPLGRMPPDITADRKKANDASLMYWVDRAIEEGLATSRNGEPGPAFEKVAEYFDISPSTARDRYYKAKKERENDPNVQMWKAVVERGNKERDS